MKTIVVASRKGGVGKTTLTGHIAVAATQAGQRVVIADGDPQQGSLSDWWNARERDDLMMVPISVLADVKATGEADLLIVDTQPSSDIDHIVQHADLVLIPVRPGPHDLRAIGHTIEIAERHGKRMVFVVSCATARSKLAADAAVELSQYGTVAPSFTNTRQDYVLSMIVGKVAQETAPDGKSAAEIAALFDYLMKQLNKK